MTARELLENPWAMSAAMEFLLKFGTLLLLVYGGLLWWITAKANSRHRDRCRVVLDLYEHGLSPTWSVHCRTKLKPGRVLCAIQTLEFNGLLKQEGRRIDLTSEGLAEARKIRREGPEWMAT